MLSLFVTIQFWNVKAPGTYLLTTKPGVPLDFRNQIPWFFHDFSRIFQDFQALMWSRNDPSPTKMTWFLFLNVASIPALTASLSPPTFSILHCSIRTRIKHVWHTEFIPWFFQKIFSNSLIFPWFWPFFQIPWIFPGLENAFTIFQVFFLIVGTLLLDTMWHLASGMQRFLLLSSNVLVFTHLTSAFWDFRQCCHPSGPLHLNLTFSLSHFCLGFTLREKLYNIRNKLCYLWIECLDWNF